VSVPAEAVTKAILKYASFHSLSCFVKLWIQNYQSRAETSSRRLSLVLPHVLVTQTRGHIYRLAE